MPKHSFFPALAALLCLFTGGPLPAQTLRQLTSFSEEYTFDSPIRAVYSFAGQVYTANDLTLTPGSSAFGVLDPTTGALRPLPGDTETLGGSPVSRPEGPFQEIDGKLFGSYATENSGAELYRITREGTERLTDQPGLLMSELVLFQGQLYFVVSGPYIGVSDPFGPTLHQMQLWRTDGTAAGTEWVADLPVYAPESSMNNYVNLAAGENALLITGHDVDFFGEMTLTLYRPGEGAVPVQVHPDAYFERAVVRSDYATDFNIASFAGAFYFVALPVADSYYDPELFRLSESTAELMPLPDVLGDAGTDVKGENASFATVGESLYLYLAGGNLGYRLYRADGTDPTQFAEIAGADTQTPRIPLTVHAGRLYFGGEDGGQGYLSALDPATGTIDRVAALTYDSEQVNLLFGDGVIYGVQGQYGETIFRVVVESGEVSYSTLLRGTMESRRSVNASVLADALIFLGQGQSAAGVDYRTPYRWDRTAYAAIPLGDFGRPYPIGVQRIFGPIDGGRVLFATLGSSAYYHIYDPAAGTVTPLPRPAGNEYRNFAYFGVVDSTQLFSYYNSAVDSFGLFVLTGDRLTELRDADLDLPLRLSGRRSTPAAGWFWESAGNNAQRVLTLQIDGSAARKVYYTEEPVYNPHYERQVHDYALVFFANGKDSVLVLRPDGAVRYAFSKSQEFALAGFGEAGYFLYEYRRGADSPNLVYYAADGSAAVPIAIPEGVVPDRQNFTQVIGRKLVFRPYNRQYGSEFYVADGATGSLTLVKDIAPGQEQGPGREMVRVENILYFAADDGETGYELWRTDGTPNGTYRIADLNAGSASSTPRNFAAVGTSLYFSATAPAGAEAFRLILDGSEKVERLADVYGGDPALDPFAFTGAAGDLYFLARPAEGAAYQLYTLGGGGAVSLPSLQRVAAEVYPNPAADRLTVSATSTGVIARLTLQDITGRFVLSAKPGTAVHEIDVSRLPVGQYLLRLEYAAGGAGVQLVAVVR